MCALGEAGAYLAERNCTVTAFDLTPEMIAEGEKRFSHIENLSLRTGDVRDFHFDIEPCDFAFCMDFGHLQTVDDVRRALKAIHAHLRKGGCLMIETSLFMPGGESSASEPRTFRPFSQIYPGIEVWKEGFTRTNADTGRFHIIQTFFAKHADGHVDSFEHAFCLQQYTREDWLQAFEDSGYQVINTYADRDSKSWQSGSNAFCIFEVIAV